MQKTLHMVLELMKILRCLLETHSFDTKVVKSLVFGQGRIQGKASLREWLRMHGDMVVIHLVLPRLNAESDVAVLGIDTANNK